MTVRVAINGFGRIGRHFFRALCRDAEASRDVELVAFNDLADTKTLAHLLKYDSIHGTFEGEVKSSEGLVEVDGKGYRVLAVQEPQDLPWKELSIDIAVESTGRFTDRRDAEGHIRAGARKVLISAPAKGPDVTVVPGVNLEDYDGTKHNIVSAASCTTNCLAPMAKVLLTNFGVKRGFMTTVHAYTNDQKLLDLVHRDLRRARAAALSIIPTTTGAASAIGQVIPELKGKMDGVALRVPVPDGSITDLVAELEKDVTKEDVNEAFRKASEKEMRGILQYTEDPIVSADVVRNPHSCIIDGLSTMVMGGRGNFVKVFGWYDNEWGYACRLVDVTKYMAVNWK